MATNYSRALSDEFLEDRPSWRAVVDPDTTSFMRARTDLARAPFVSGESGVFDAPYVGGDSYNLSQAIAPINRARRLASIGENIAGENRMRMLADRDRGLEKIRLAAIDRRRREYEAKRAQALAIGELVSKIGGKAWAAVAPDEVEATRAPGITRSGEKIGIAPEKIGWGGEDVGGQEYGWSGIIQDLEEKGGTKDQDFAQFLRDFFQ